MVDFKIYFESLKASWVTHLVGVFSVTGNIIPLKYIKTLGRNILVFNINTNDKKYLTLINSSTLQRSYFILDEIWWRAKQRPDKYFGSGLRCLRHFQHYVGSIVLVEEIGVHGENHRPDTSH